MPLYDRKCKACEWVAIDVWERVYAMNPPCPECGAETNRAWLTRTSQVIGDEIDVIQKNGTKTPIHFRSRLERKRWMKEQGLREFDTHVGDPGSDKSTHTRSWDTFDPYTAECKRILLERAAQCGAQYGEDELPEMHITTTTGELSAEEAKKYVQR